MVVRLTCKNEEDPIKNEIARILTRLYVLFSVAQAQLISSAVSGGIWPKFELNQAFIIFLDTCKNEEDPIKNEIVRVLTRLYVIFSDAQAQLTPQSVVEFGRNSNPSKLL